MLNLATYMQKVALTKLLHKEMDRKEFLFYIGIFLLAVTGISHIIKNLTELLDTKNSSLATTGFGSDVYGGAQRKDNS